MANKDFALVNLTPPQTLILQQSDEDIKAGRLISHEQIKEDDLKWLNNFASIDNDNCD